MRLPRQDRCDLGAIGLIIGGAGMPVGEGLEVAQAADEAGIDLLGAGDGFVENLSVMGALATRTARAELISCVMGWTRTPVTMALAGWTMQELSGGRYRMGFGTMPKSWSEDWHDIEASRPASRMRDFVSAVRAAWASDGTEGGDYSGSFYRVRGYQRPTRGAMPPPPIYLAATRPRMSQLAAEIADGVIFNLFNSADWLRDVGGPRLDTGLQRARRAREDFDIGILLYCAISDDRAAAIDAVRPALAFYFGVPYFAEMLVHHGMQRELELGRRAAQSDDHRAMAAAVSDEMVKAFALAGTPDDVRAQLRRYRGLVDFALLTPPVMNAADETRRMALRIISTFCAEAQFSPRKSAII